MKKILLTFHIIFFTFILCITGCDDGGGQTIINPNTVALTPTFNTNLTPTIPLPVSTPSGNTGEVTGYIMARIDGENDINSLNLLILSSPPLLSNYAPVKDAKIYVTNNPFIETTSDIAGKFTLKDVPYSTVSNIITLTVAGDTQNIQAHAQFTTLDFPVIVNLRQSPVNIAAVNIAPDNITLVPGQAYQFKAYCKNNSGDLLNPEQIIWDVTTGLGNIDSSGILIVGQNTGTGTVTAKVGSLLGSASVIVANRANMASITGKVTFSDGSPATTCEVSITSGGIKYYVFPDGSGQYNLNNIPPGTRKLEVIYKETLIWSKDISVNSSETLTENIVLDYDPVGPEIVSLSRLIGLPTNSVTITGNHFGMTQGNGTVTFNGVNITPTSWSNNSIVITPSGAVTGDIVVTVHGVASNGINYTITAIRYIVFDTSRNVYNPIGDSVQKVLLYDMDSLSIIDQPDKLGIHTSYAQDPDITPDGRYIIYAGTISPGDNEILLYDRTLESTIILPNIGQLSEMPIKDIAMKVSISGDGQYIAFCDWRAGGQGQQDIYLYNRGNSSFITLPGLNSISNDYEPSISDDGKIISFTSDRSGVNKIYLYNISTSSLIDLTDLNNSEARFPSLNLDGRYITCVNTGIKLYDTINSNFIPLENIITGEGVRCPSMNSDGRYIVYSRYRINTTTGDGLGSWDIFLYDRNISKVISLPNLNSPYPEFSASISD